MEQGSENPPRSLLENLPLHLLFTISGYLGQLQPNTRSSVFALSLASKTCNEATDPERFRHIHISIVGPQKLQQDIQHWRRILGTGHRLSFVRSVKITGITISSEEEEDLIKKGDISGSTLPMIQSDKMADIEGRGGDAEANIPKLFSGLDKFVYYGCFLPTPSTSWPDETAWQPLLGLISDLPALKDVIFGSRDELPRLLLSALHEHHPNCRLHMHCFKLPSLIIPERAEQKVHPRDIALASSPCLCSLVVYTQPYAARLTWDYNEEAVMAMVKGVAPNLKNVSLTHGIHQGAPGPFSTMPRPRWRGFESSTGRVHEGRSSMGRIENLALNRYMTGEILLQWSFCTDFRYLRSMKAGPGFDISAVRQLAEISQRTPLSALSSLTLNISSRYPPETPDPTVDPVVAELLQSLCPLEVLELYGCLREKSFEAITTYQGEKLRKLTFVCRDPIPELFEFTPERAAQLSRNCPRLETTDVREPEYMDPSGMILLCAGD